MDEARAAWADAFTKAQAQLVNPPKKRTVNTGKFSYSYAELPDIIDSVRQVLAEHGLSFAQSVEGAGSYGVTTRIYHRVGHCEEFGPLLLPAGSTAQEAGSAITYARRYALCAALGIAAEDDDDGAAASKGSGAGKRLGKAQPVPEQDSVPVVLPSTGADGTGGAHPTPGPTSSKYPRTATQCGADGHPAWVDGEASCPDCGAPPSKVLRDRAEAS